MVSTATSNRQRQAQLIKNLRLRRLQEESQRDPALMAMTSAQIDDALVKANVALRETPRPGLKRWVKALAAEKRKRRNGG